MNTIMTAMQCDAIIHEFSEKATRVKEINSFLCLLKNAIFQLSVFDPEATICALAIACAQMTNRQRIFISKCLNYLIF